MAGLKAMPSGLLVTVIKNPPVNGGEGSIPGVEEDQPWRKSSSPTTFLLESFHGQKSLCIPTVHGFAKKLDMIE